LILADGEDVRDLLPNDDRIRLIHIDEGCRIGEKRNFGCDRASGEIIAHWDDDDFSAPARLSDQVHRLLQSGKPVTAYHSMHFTDGREWWQYRGNSGVAIGSSLCFRKSWWREHPFPAKQVGEDGEFARAALRAGQLITAPAGLLMAASIHPGNTSPRQLSGHPWHHEPEFAGVPGL
jgi:DNA-binding transcriptional LysR family regulator